MFEVDGKFERIWKSVGLVLGLLGLGFGGGG